MRLHEIDSYIGMVITDNSTVSGMLVEGGLDIPDHYIVVVTHDEPYGHKEASQHDVIYALKDAHYRNALPSERMKNALKVGWLSTLFHDADVDDILF